MRKNRREEYILKMREFVVKVKNYVLELKNKYLYKNLFTQILFLFADKNIPEQLVEYEAIDVILFAYTKEKEFF